VGRREERTWAYKFLHFGWREGDFDLCVEGLDHFDLMVPNFLFKLRSKK
jgi:hypothetical protein